MYCDQWVKHGRTARYNCSPIDCENMVERIGHPASIEPMISIGVVVLSEGQEERLLHVLDRDPGSTDEKPGALGPTRLLTMLTRTSPAAFVSFRCTRPLAISLAIAPSPPRYPPITNICANVRRHGASRWKRECRARNLKRPPSAQRLVATKIEQRTQQEHWPWRTGRRWRAETRAEGRDEE